MKNTRENKLKITTEVKEQAIKYYCEGHTIKEVLHNFPVSISYIKRLLKQRELLRLVTNKIPREKFAGIEEVFDKHKKIKIVADYYDVDSATIIKVLKEFGIDPNYYKNIDLEAKEQAIKYYCERHTITETFENFPISMQYLKKILMQRGLFRKESYHVEMKCEICGDIFLGCHPLTKHIKNEHKIESNDYYDRYLKRENEGKCVICTSPTKYKDIVNGYIRTCGHSCGCTLHRRNLKADPIKSAIFSQKVRGHKTAWHASQTIEEKKDFFSKIGEKVRKTAESMTPEERKEKHGYLNKLGPKEREEFIENLKSTGAHSWWKTASEEEKRVVYDRRRATRCKSKGWWHLDDDEIKNNYAMYHQKVCTLTASTYKKYKSIINPTNLKRGIACTGYHLDHKYSICQGFLEGLLPEVISSVHNLQMLTGTENMSKSDTCSVTKEELLSLYESNLLK